MRRGSKVFLLVGVFLVVSVLWPYDPTTDTSDAVQAYRGGIVFPKLDPPSFVLMEDRWNGASSLFVFASDPMSLVPGLPIELEVPPGKTILPDTEFLLFSHTITDAEGNPSDLMLTLRGANGAGWQVPLTGALTKIRITEEMNDWTPDPNTRWTFTLASTNGVVTIEGLRLDIVRSDTRLPDLLEYEDHWDGADRRRIFDQYGALHDARVAPREPNDPVFQATVSAPVANEQPPAVPRIQNVPARDITELHVELLYNSSTPSAFHYQPTLFFRGANLDGNEWEFGGVPPTMADPEQVGGRFVWRLPIEPAMWDSPFAPETHWDLLINWRGQSTDMPVYMDGNFHLWVDVIRDAPN